MELGENQSKGYVLVSLKGKNIQNYFIDLNKIETQDPCL